MSKESLDSNKKKKKNWKERDAGRKLRTKKIMKKNRNVYQNYLKPEHEEKKK